MDGGDWEGRIEGNIKVFTFVHYVNSDIIQWNKMCGGRSTYKRSQELYFVHVYFDVQSESINNS